MRKRIVNPSKLKLTISEVISGGLITGILFLLRYFDVFYIDSEIVFAPLIVSVLLAFGDKLLLFLFVSPINFIYKLVVRLKSEPQKAELSLKQ